MNKEVDFDDVFTGGEIWALRLFGVGVYAMLFGGIFTILNELTLITLLLTTSATAGIVDALSLEIARRTRPDNVTFEFDDDFKDSALGRLFANLFVGAIMVWVFVVLIGVLVAIAAQFITLDVLTVSCILGGMLYLIFTYQIEFTSDRVTILQFNRVSSGATSTRSTSSQQETSQSSQLSELREYVTEARSHLEADNIDAAKQSLKSFDRELTNGPAVTTDDRSELKEEVADLRDRIATVKKLKESLSTADAAREQSRSLLDKGQYKKARDRVEDGLAACQKAERLADPRRSTASESIASLRADLETIQEQAETVIDRIETAKEHYASVRNALDAQSYGTAKTDLTKLENTLADVSEYDSSELEKLRTDAERIKDHIDEQIHDRLTELSESAESTVSQAEEHLEKTAFEEAHQQLQTAKKPLETAISLTNEHNLAQTDEIQTKIKDIEYLIDLVDKARAKRQATERALKSRSYESAESEMGKLEATIEQIASHDGVGVSLDELQQSVSQLEERIEVGRAENRLNGLLGSIGSSLSRGEDLCEDGEYGRALRRFESALETIDEASSLNEKYSLGKGEALSNKRTDIEELLSDTAEALKNKHSSHVTKAEKAVARGINNREADDLAAALDDFAEAHERYTEALALANEHDLAELWETKQRHSMVTEYLDTAREELDDRRRTTRNELEQTLERAEAVMARAQQYAEVNDHVSVRDSLDDLVSELDQAAQLLNVEGRTDELQTRYNSLVDQKETLRKSLPDEAEADEYRNQALIKSLQTLATKLGESPRPEFVNAYGEYPAEAYLNAFGSWPDALAAANLNPLDEDARERRSYSRVDVLDELTRVAGELGHPPSKSEMNEHGNMSASPVESRFADWETALGLAGLLDAQAPDSEEHTEQHASKTEQQSAQDTANGGKISEPETGSDSSTDSPSEETLIQELKRIDSFLDRIPYTSDINEESKFTAKTYMNHFGSWDAALEAAGIDKEAALLTDLQQVAEKVGKTPGQTDVNRHGTYSASMYARFFDSWSDAKSGFEDWQEKQSASQSTTEEAEDGLSKDDPSEDDLLDALVEVAESVGDVPTRSDMINEGKYPLQLYGKKFNSLDDAIEQSRLQDDKPTDTTPSVQPKGSTYTDTDVIGEIQRVAETVDGKPTVSDMNERGRIPMTTITDRFGSWQTAIDEAGLTQSEQIEDIDDSDSPEDQDEILEEIERELDNLHSSLEND